MAVNQLWIVAVAAEECCWLLMYCILETIAAPKTWIESAVLMTVCNFIIHGVRGEVVCGNSLDPTDYREDGKSMKL